MLKKRISKIVIAFICIIVMLMQYTGTLLAATMSYKDTTAKLRLSILHEGGRESSGTLTEEQQKIYDENPYLYFVGDTRVYKITEKDGLFENSLYCLDASKAFPAEGSIVYRNTGNMLENDKYNSESLKWLVENFYLRKQEPELKDSFLEKVFGDSEYDLDVVKAVLTDDDIDVIQQYAIWNFTNSDNPKYNKLGAIRVISGTDILLGAAIDKTNAVSFKDINSDKYKNREDMARYLYDYLINSAESNQEETNYETQATIWEPEDNKYQPVILITREDKKTEEPSTYKLQLVKRDSMLNVNLPDADFNIQIGNNEPKMYTTDENGIIEIPNIEIEEEGTDRILIQEINPPYGYIADSGILELKVTKTEVDGKYKITNLDSERSSVQVEDAYIDDKEQTVVVKICNTQIPYDKPPEEEIKGKYELEIVKVDRNGKIIESPANFNINNKVYTTEQGRVKTAEIDINRLNVNQTDKYEIKETKAPEGYSKFDGTIEVEVLKKLSDDEGSYKATNANIIVKDDDGNILHRGDKVKITTKNGVTTITITIVNYDKVDLSLRKFIKAVSANGIFEEANYIETREPQVDLEDLDSGKSTTAKYNHSKETVIVKKGDYILYTLRVYNEGNYNAMASQIVDYLPEGIEFVNDTKENEIWNYDEDARKLTTNEKYEAKLLEAHEKGKDLDYQDLQVVCKIKNDVEEDTNIVNIAEIVEAKYEDGQPAEDRDSTTNNIKYPDDISKYNGGVDLDKADDYIPGQEDDDDFERIYVKSPKGYYDLEIVKVDNNGKTIKEAKFSINNQEKETQDGIITIENIEINKNNIQKSDKYTIKEISAPENYSKFDGTLEIEVNKKLSDDEEKYEVENVKVNGEENKNIEIINENGRTKIVVKIANYPKVDLALRKYISAVSKDITFEEEEYYKDREPKVNLEELDSGKSTTAKYEHEKKTIVVEKEDFILYTIRVYNEGKINAIASEITDYLPEGLEFVKDAKENEIWNYDKDTRKLTTNEKYKAKLLEAHEVGKELSYQDLQVVCKVSKDIKEDTEIINIAEITEIKHEDGTIAEDIDSTPNNVDTNKYNPDTEDDDDYEKILVKSIKGEYNLKIVKVDEKGKTINDLVTKFKVNNEQKETKNGIIELPKVEINKETIDKKDEYVISEIEAPEGYEKIKYTDIKVIVSKKLSEDGKSYIVDEAKLEVTQKEPADKNQPISKKELDKIATISVKDGTIELKVVNNKKEEPQKPQPEEPKKPQEPQQPNNPAPQPQKQQKVYTPSTGDILPIIVIVTIFIVAIVNIVQIIVSKKKENK